MGHSSAVLGVLECNKVCCARQGKLLVWGSSLHDAFEHIPPFLLPHGFRSGGVKGAASYITTRVAPHCVNALRTLHAAYGATNPTYLLVNTDSIR